MTKEPVTLQKSAVSKPIYKSVPSAQHHFVAEVQKRSPHDLVMIGRDPFHHLYCELPLKIQEAQEGRKGSLVLTCKFPMIGDCALVDLIEEDEELLGFIMICFHLHILENLFLFCTSRKATKLIIRTMEMEFQGMNIYEGFIESIKPIQTPKGVSLELTIPLHAQFLEDCRIYLDDVMEKFRYTLWHDQKTNPAMRAYVFRNLRMSVVASKRESKRFTINLNRERRENDND